MDKIFTKDDIRYGYVVKFRNGRLSIAMPTHACGSEKVITALRTPGTGWGDLGDYTSDMLAARDNSDYDIMEVYGYSKYAHRCTDVSTDFRELLWKREEKTCNNCAKNDVCWKRTFHGNKVIVCDKYLSVSAAFDFSNK